MSGHMNPAEFANIRISERDFWWYRGMREIFFRFLDRHLAGRKINRALEAGCGTGYLSSLMQTERHWPVIPMDIAWAGLCHAREMGVERLIQGDTAELPFSSGAFDLVVSVDVLAHIPPGEEFRAAAELARVLAPGGTLALRTAALDILKSHHSEHAMELQRFTRGRLVRLFEGAGLRVRRCTYANSLLLPVAFAKFRIWEPLSRQAPNTGVAPVAPWLDSLLHAPLAFETAWIGAGGGFPAGQSLMLIGEKIS
jgi:SAM-dependent methyltransferase